MPSISPERLRVLVTGADQHQGLAVIRGLGRAGASVVACGPHRGSLGYYSRYADAAFSYTSPFRDRGAFVEDLLRIARRTRPTLIMPAVESTLVVLDACRARIEHEVPLGIPSSEALAFAIDKCRTIQLAERLCVAVPRTARGDTVGELLDRAAALRFPVAIKPQGNRLHAATAHGLDFKVQYARTVDELRGLLAALDSRSGCPLVQEYVHGAGLCVDVVCRHGAPVAIFPYVKSREVPLSGGVSVVRESVELDERVERAVIALLGEIGWNGIAMVEFKYDAREDRYVLMEINGRFSAATALSLDAGLNLPYLAACVHTGRALPTARPPYRVGVRARWLGGDLHALQQHLTERRRESDAPAPIHDLPSKWGAARAFVGDFGAGMHYDEFKWWDWKPGLVEAVAVGAALVGWAKSVCAGAVRTVIRRRRTG